MPYSTNRDRNTPILEIQRAPWPAPPLNVFLTGNPSTHGFDLSWDNPCLLALNGRFTILGVHIYRSFDSEFGPYERITEAPVGATFWRDLTDIELVEEDVSEQFILRGDHVAAGQEQPRYVFRTQHSPIVKEASSNISADQPWDVRVFVDGVEATVLRVQGFSGEVELDPRQLPEAGTQSLTAAVLPGPSSRVVCVYRRMRSYLRTDLAQRVFYRVVTVGVSNDPKCPESERIPAETPLENAAATNSYEIEKLDYIWREAIRRNRWILEQGGERVQAFLRKNAGIPCPCIPDELHGQPVNDCLKCYGTGFLGGYEGPYPILIAPDDAEKRITQGDRGRYFNHEYEVWTGPVPLLSQRDFVMKINGERYSIGPVRMPSNRGNLLQQHFNIGAIDSVDIRYRVPIDNPNRFSALSYNPAGPEQAAEAQPTEKPNIPDERELRGRTPVWENIEY
jgi:hypothetical protein